MTRATHGSSHHIIHAIGICLLAPTAAVYRCGFGGVWGGEDKASSRWLQGSERGMKYAK